MAAACAFLLSGSGRAGGRTRVGPVNRIAVHQSIVHPFDPVGLVRLAERAGIDSVGLHVATTPEVETWWVKGIGAAMLRDLVAALLAARVTVLDVGRVRLGPELRVWDGQHAYASALELGVRLGAQFVTARADADVADDPAELFAVLDELAGRYRLRPLLAVVAGTPAATPAAAAAIVDGTHGGIVLDVSPRTDSPAAVAETVVELGELLGYVRVPAHELGAVSGAGPARHAPAAGAGGDRRAADRGRRARPPGRPGISHPSRADQPGPHDPTAATEQARGRDLGAAHRLARRGGRAPAPPRRIRTVARPTPGRGRTGGPPDRGTPGRSCPAGARACGHRARGRLPRPRRDR